MFLNFNPSELNSRACIELCGQTYQVDALSGGAIDRPSAQDRWRLVAANPVACAEFFQAVIRAIQEVYFGWPLGAPQQKNADCLFGIITAMVTKYETSGRLALHMHGLISQPSLQPRRVLHYLSVGKANNIFQFLEYLACSWLPEPDRSLTEHGAEARASRSEKARPRLPSRATRTRTTRRVPSQAYSAPTPPRTLTEQLREVTVTSTTPLQSLQASMSPTDVQAVIATEAQLDTWSQDVLCKYVGTCVLALQIHAHSHTCAKNGHQGNDVDCRMLYPRLLILMSIMLNGAHILMRRDHANVVAFNPSLMLALPFNHAIYVLSDQSRWARRKQLYDEAVARGDTRLTEPQLFSMIVEAFLASCYALKYSTKVDASGVNAPVLDVVKVRDGQTLGNMQRSEPSCSGIIVIAHACHLRIAGFHRESSGRIRRHYHRPAFPSPCHERCQRAAHLPCYHGRNACARVRRHVSYARYHALLSQSILGSMARQQRL